MQVMIVVVMMHQGQKGVFDPVPSAILMYAQDACDERLQVIIIERRKRF